MRKTTFNKVATISLSFWLMKICATTLGETAGDLISMTLKVGYALSSVLLLGLFIISVALQLRAKRYRPFIYWSVILTTSIAGTTMSDFLDRSLDLGYAAGASILALTLGAILLLWQRCIGNLAVNTISSTKVEVFYWASILASNTLGTALGDYLADDSGLGFAGSATLIGGLIGLTLLAHYFTRINGVILFWLAFVLTRPFGATFGDFLTKPVAQGGFHLGTVNASLILLVPLLALAIRAHIQQTRTSTL